MKNKKKGLEKSFHFGAGVLGRSTRSNVIRTKASDLTTPTSTPKTSAYQDGPPYEPIHFNLRLYRQERAELLWRYKASRAMLQKLRTDLITLESVIYKLAPTQEEASNILKSIYGIKEAPTTFETGQPKTLSKSSDFEPEKQWIPGKGWVSNS